jgi:hypothetical protein
MTYFATVDSNLFVYSVEALHRLQKLAVDGEVTVIDDGRVWVFDVSSEVFLAHYRQIPHRILTPLIKLITGEDWAMDWPQIRHLTPKQIGSVLAAVVIQDCHVLR